ncbi:MAG: efflux RND transporter permease subunit [Dysgonamonadaceae bacterium]|jgi:multidrug efflux pump subunit AcrB|nr:efflux RND transporter permease subunit [Dysgonamonadaceae bacterium]
MIKFLINRPIAVFMSFTAFFILGIITYLNVPVSLLPDIAIPEITVQVTGKDMSARELENLRVSGIRRSLMQVSKLRDIRSETRDGSAILRLSFEYGTNTELAFIDVNEKIDESMRNAPAGTERPRVIKASATDIPVFNINLTLKNTAADEEAFLAMSEVAEMIIRRQIEQLPEVAMVDMTGIVGKRVIIQPDREKMLVAGISLDAIEQSLTSANFEGGSATVRDGFYEYNITFSEVMRTVEDICNIYIRHNDRIYQLKNLARVEVAPQEERGMAFYNGHRAIIMSIIKQADQNMADMQKTLDVRIENLRGKFPDIEFNISQNQTELLDYTISNLQQNLLVAFLFVCLISVIFMRDIRSPLIIGLSMFVALVISLMFFYLCKVSLNVVSLTGLVLALGNMIDSSIIVTDNIGQHRQRGLTIDDACIRGTNEVIAPMLSSMFTNIAVFVPLIFMSGIAGALFFDQAFSVTVGLLVSYFTGIMLLPVLYKLTFRKKAEKIADENLENLENLERKKPLLDKIYDASINWVFSHKTATTVMVIAFLPLCFVFFKVIPKEKMPQISQNEIIVKIDWNANIHVEENSRRTNELLQHVKNIPYFKNMEYFESSAQVAAQQFLLNREQEQSSSETEIYLKTAETSDIPALKQAVSDYFAANYPKAVVSFSPVDNIFEKIFTTGDPELTVEYYTLREDDIEKIEVSDIRQLEENLAAKTGETPVGNAFQKQLNIHIDKEKLLLYGVSQGQILQALQTGFRENQFALLRSYQQYLPIVIGFEKQNIRDVIEKTTVDAPVDNGNAPNSFVTKIPLSVFVTTSPAEDLKTIVAGSNGEYIPLQYYKTERQEEIMKIAREDARNSDFWKVDFSGNYFFNKKMISELIVILLISIMLMYFILAAQFESFVQPLIVLLEIPMDICASLALLMLLGHSLNLMSAIGIVVSTGIIINDSILKVDVMNQLRREGFALMDAIHEAGRRRLKAILMTTLTSIVCMAPLLFSYNLGAELEKPLAIATIGGMLLGTPISLFVVPLVYWAIYRKEEK